MEPPATLIWAVKNALVADIFIAAESLTGFVGTQVTQSGTRKDWAAFVRHLLDDYYPEAEKVVPVMDNLNTHEVASCYAAFPVNEVLSLSKRLEIHHTPNMEAG